MNFIKTVSSVYVLPLFPRSTYGLVQKFSYSIACVFMLWAFPQSAEALTAYTITPLVIDIPIEARDIITKEITITNTGDQQISLYPTVNNISLAEGGTIQEFLSPVQSDRTASLAAWIEISRLGIDINPGESKTIPVTFRIHPSPVPGTYHAFIGFGNGHNRTEVEKLLKLGQVPGTVITATIAEKRNEFMKLSKFIVSRIVTRNDNQAAVYTFTNPGDEPVIPKGEIILYDPTGKEVGAIPVNEEGAVVPPGGERSFTAQVPADGLFGKYKAFLSVEYGTTQRALVNDTSFFYVFPLNVMLSILGVLIIAAGGTAWYVHQRYLDEDLDDSEHLTVHIRDSKSEAKDHDVDLKKKT